MFTAQGNNKGILRRTFWGAVEEIEYVNTTLDGCIFVISQDVQKLDNKILQLKKGSIG